ncbi:MAG: sugar phosphate isomerase/epimerase [Thermoprotei archaeon]|nr:MAG: sugar phosphate isomerase/epimerase [Thermoprotei archaeon]
MLGALCKIRGVEIAAKFPWKIGVVSFMLYPELMKRSEGVAETIIKIAQDPYIDLIEVSKVSDKDWALIKERATEVEFARGLQPMILGGLDISSLDEETRRKALDALKKEIEHDVKYGIKAFGICTGKDPGEAKRKEASEKLVDSLIELTSIAKNYGAVILLETFDRKWDKKLLLGPIGEAAQVVEKVREVNNNIKLLWDLSHAPMLEEKPEDLKPYADLIGHIHIGCTKRVEDKLYDWHPGFYRPGALNTVDDVAKLLEVLLDIKYGEAVSFEVKPEENQLPEEVFYTAKQVLTEAFIKILEKI